LGQKKSVVPVVVQRGYTSTAWARRERCFTVGAMVRGFTLGFIASVGDAGSAIVLSMMGHRYYGLTPG